MSSFESVVTPDQSSTGLPEPDTRYAIYAWIVAGLLNGVGDVGTTYIGLEVFGLPERNPLIQLVYAGNGFEALILAKIAGFTFMVVAWMVGLYLSLDDGESDLLGVYLILYMPVWYSVFGVAVVSSNLFALYTAGGF